MTRRVDIAARLPTVLAARRAEAAAMCGISASTFDRLVMDGILPPARMLGPCAIWLSSELASALADLPVDGAGHVDGATMDGVL